MGEMTIRPKYLRTVLTRALKMELGVDSHKTIPKSDPMLNEEDLHHVEKMIMSLPEVRLFCEDESQSFRIFALTGYNIRKNLRRWSLVGGTNEVPLRELKKLVIRASVSAMKQVLEAERHKSERHSNTNTAKLFSKDATERERTLKNV